MKLGYASAFVTAGVFRTMGVWIRPTILGSSVARSGTLGSSELW